MNRYYEGKEYEVRITDKKPGQLSDRLRVSIDRGNVYRMNDGNSFS